VLANSIGATLALARRAWVQIYRLELLILQAPPNIRSSVQAEKACNKEDDDDDADDVENVHGTLRVRDARFQQESTALHQATSRSASKFQLTEAIGGKGGQFYTD
jgi:hypothetical protein